MVGSGGLLDSKDDSPASQLLGFLTVPLVVLSSSVANHLLKQKLDGDLGSGESLNVGLVCQLRLEWAPRHVEIDQYLRARYGLAANPCGHEGSRACRIL
ncbi:hypothetical protein GCM10020331_091640 [Ectobacillus funiculus]